MRTGRLNLRGLRAALLVGLLGLSATGCVTFKFPEGREIPLIAADAPRFTGTIEGHAHSPRQGVVGRSDLECVPVLRENGQPAPTIIQCAMKHWSVDGATNPDTGKRYNRFPAEGYNVVAVVDGRLAFLRFLVGGTPPMKVVQTSPRCAAVLMNGAVTDAWWEFCGDAIADLIATRRRG